MKIHIVSIFPECFESYFSSSIIWNAREKWLFEIEFYKLNNFSLKRFGHIDDKAYGMHGQVLCARPLAWAIDFIFEKVGNKIPVLYMSPGWELLTQEKVENYAESLEEFIIICWHYEGIDERIIKMYNVCKISIWEYVISSGELAASVFVDALVRHIPWVLGNVQSLNEESFSKQLNRQKEYPVYTRPQEFCWMEVPEVLLSWNHSEIEKWKKNNLF
jgi:tRNA (guanine37-N1)-methyltransferase